MKDYRLWNPVLAEILTLVEPSTFFLLLYYRGCQTLKSNCTKNIQLSDLPCIVLYLERYSISLQTLLEATSLRNVFNVCRSISLQRKSSDLLNINKSHPLSRRMLLLREHVKKIIAFFAGHSVRGGGIGLTPGR